MEFPELESTNEKRFPLAQLHLAWKNLFRKHIKIFSKSPSYPKPGPEEVMGDFRFLNFSVMFLNDFG
jgi:hypothetical protein